MRISCSLLFLVSAFAVAQPPGPGNPAPPPVVAFAITDPDDKGGTVVPVLNAVYPFVGGTYPKDMEKERIFVTIIDQNAKVIDGGEATKNNGVFVWQSAFGHDPVNPVFIYADTGKNGFITNSVKANMK